MLNDYSKNNLQPDNYKILFSNINKLYIFDFCHSLVYAYVIERLFGLERGITIQQMIYIEIIYAAVALLLEIPSGIFADVYGRKISIVISSALCFFEFYILIYAFSFWAFCLSSIFAAVSGALASGSINALLYDSLKLNNQEDKFEKIVGRQKFYSTLAACIGALSGAYIAEKYGYVSTYYLSAMSATLGLMVSFTLKEIKPNNSSLVNVEEKIEEEVEKIEIFNIREIISFFRVNKDIKALVIYSVLFGAVIGYIDEYYQIYLKEINLPLSLFGFCLVLRLLSEGISQLYAHRVKKIFSYKKLFFLCISISGISLIGMIYIKNIYGIIFLMIIFMLYGLTEPLIFGYIHHRITSSYRATIESFVTFLLSFVSIIIGLIFGYLSTNYSIYIGFLFLGSVMLFYSLYFVLVEKFNTEPVN